MLWDVIEKRLQAGPVIFDHPVDGEWVLYRDDDNWCMWEAYGGAMGNVYVDTVKGWLTDPDLVLVDWFEDDYYTTGSTSTCTCDFTGPNLWLGCRCGNKP